MWRCLLVSALLAGGLVEQAAARVELAPCKNHLTPEQQIALGQKVVQQVYKQMPVLPDSSPVTQYIQHLGAKLTAQAPGYKWPYNFHVANVAEINAFALPGGTVFVNLGTIQAAEDEAQLAGVMAHEISHVVLQHSVCNAEKQQRVGAWAGLGQIAAGVLLGGAAGQLTQEGIGFGAGLGFLKMSRGAEQQADLMGVGILYDAGYDPHGMAQFFEIIQQKYGKGGAQFTSDHPNPGNRTEYVNKEIATFVPKPNYVTDSPEFKSIHAQVAGMHAYTSREVQSGAWKQQSPNETVGAGVSQPSQQLVGPAAADLAPAGDWKTLRGNLFSIRVPGNWQAYGNKVNGMVAPAGGFAWGPDGGASGVTHGMLTGVYQYQGRMTMGAALDSLVAGMARDNPGLTAGPQSKVTAGGADGVSAECTNTTSNQGQGEKDWVVAFRQGDSALRYFVFVAPPQDFEQMRPTFQRMLETLSLR